MGTSRQIVTEYGFDDLSNGVTLGAAHCGFDVSQYRGEYVKIHAELCREFGWDQSAKIILFVGRMEGAEVLYQGKAMTHKNPGLALEIAKGCIQRDDRTKLLMVGAVEGKREEFDALTKEWEIHKSVRFTGARSDVPRLMLGSDLLLFPSVAEGLGMVVVEAQAAGLRVLASHTTPRESAVVPDMVAFYSLGEPAVAWVTEALNIINFPRPDAHACNALVQASPFSIENSAELLRLFYQAQPFGREVA